MRSRPPLATPRSAKRVAQPAPAQPPAAQPAPGQAPAPGPDQPPADGEPADPANPGTPASADPLPAPALESIPAAPPAPAAAQVPELSDDEFAKLAEQDFKEEVILVTGSTIGRKNLTTPAPLSVLDRELLNSAGRSTVGDIIQQLPAQSNGINAQQNVGGDGSTRVDIRGLGAARTLVLINGRRVVPSGTGANVSVDVNTIPLAIVDRVEVLKDGASAIYGSDAIGGVVNIITRSDFDGNEVSLYAGGAHRGDGLAYDGSMVIGHNSDNKKANLIFSVGMQNQKPVWAADRAFSSQDRTYDYANRTVIQGGATAVPGGRLNARAIDINADGRPDTVDVCGAGVQYCTSNGVGGYRPFITPDDLYNYQPINYLYTPSSRYNMFSAGSYKLAPQVSTFFEASYANRKSEQQIAEETFINNAPISKDSMYNPLGGTVLGYQRRFVEFGPRRTDQKVDTFRVVGGLKGAIPDSVDLFGNFKWELSYNHGRNDGESTNEGNLIKSRLATAIGPSFMNAAGLPTCGTPTKPIPGCVPMNILGPAGSIDPAAASYVTFTGVRAGFNQQQTALAQAHGRLLKLPNNGDLSIAFGGDFRKESGGTTPDPLTATGDTTGSAVAPTAGSYHVVEGYGEVSLVPLSGKKFAEWVEIDLAARAFRYNTFGTGATWKAGGMFRTINGFAVRGTYSTAFRAPSVVDLYQGKADLFNTVVDPCDTRPLGTPITLDPEVAEQCAAHGVSSTAAFGAQTTRIQVSGNPKLEPETAKLLTAGVVFEPPQIKGLSLTVDYWRHDIAKAIQGLRSAIVLANCYSKHIQSYCDQVHRNPLLGNAIDYVETPITNVGGAAGSGVDVALAFDHALGAAGRFREQFESQYLLTAVVDNTLQHLSALNNYDFGARPQLRAKLSSLWQHPVGAGAGFNLRYVGAFKECDQNSCSVGAPSRKIALWYAVDAFSSYTLKSAAGATSITFGVNNLLDRDPPMIYSALFGDYDSATYDFRGRYFYARMSQQF